MGKKKGGAKNTQEQPTASGQPTQQGAPGPSGPAQQPVAQAPPASHSSGPPSRGPGPAGQISGPLGPTLRGPGPAALISGPLGPTPRGPGPAAPISESQRPPPRGLEPTAPISSPLGPPTRGRGRAARVLGPQQPPIRAGSPLRGQAPPQQLAPTQQGPLPHRGPPTQPKQPTESVPQMEASQEIKQGKKAKQGKKEPPKSDVSEPVKVTPTTSLVPATTPASTATVTESDFPSISSLSLSSAAPTVEKEGGSKKSKKKGKGAVEVGTTKSAGEPSSTQAKKQLPDPTPAVAGESAVISGKQMLKELVKQGPTYEIPRRKDKLIKHNPKNILRQMQIEVNYLPLKLKSQMKIYHYDVLFKPDTPKSLLRAALKIMREKHFPDRSPAFDGRKNLFVGGRMLKFPNGTTLRDTVNVFDREMHREKEFDVTITLTNNDLDMARLWKYMETGRSVDTPQDVIQGTDIALRSNLADNFVTVGRSFFTPPDRAPVQLGDGLELWHGFFQSAIMAWKPYLNVDVANKGFPVPQNVIDYLINDCQCNDRDLNNPDGLPPNIRSRLQRYIKGLKVEYRMPSNEPGGVSKRTYKVQGISTLSALRHKFKPSDEEREISVMEYFQRIKRKTLKYPNLPLIEVGNKGVMLPAELCWIASNQVVMRKLDERQTSVMVRNAATDTNTRKERIMRNIAKAQYNQNATLKEFGIEVSSQFEKVNALVFRPPQIEYKDRRTAEVRDGVWRPDRLHFIQSPGLHSWGVLVIDQRDQRNASRLVNELITCGRNIGIPVEQPKFTEVFRARQTTEQTVVDQLRQYVQRQLQMVVVIMSTHPDIYSYIKRASELKTGVLTQCLKGRTVDRINSMTAHNILLKINSKISGVNHTIPQAIRPTILNKPVMIVGADVTHPAPGSENVPSIAAVAASHDPCGFKYNMKYRLQPSRMEMITDLKQIMIEQLKFFFTQTKCKPTSILYFRDGVSEGQFSQILSIELLAIRAACSSLQADYKPGITFVVVQKRHHTRFFPKPGEGDRKNNNVPAGTIVDTQITHPTELDFYLVSHQSIQGTARPTKYHLLWDDNNFGDEELELLTYYLCHMFARCNRSVSYPAPTYYAHLGAFRARAWWDNQRINMTQLDDEQKNNGTINTNITGNFPMFFV